MEIGGFADEDDVACSDDSSGGAKGSALQGQEERAFERCSPSETCCSKAPGADYSTTACLLTGANRAPEVVAKEGTKP